jgi:hypothetical protein
LERVELQRTKRVDEETGEPVTKRVKKRILQKLGKLKKKACLKAKRRTAMSERSKR